MRSSDEHPRATYEIQVRGELDQSWQQWFDGLALTLTQAGDEPPTTVLRGTVADQAALRGLLGKLWDLNLTVLSVRRIAADDEKEEGDG